MPFSIVIASLPANRVPIRTYSRVVLRQPFLKRALDLSLAIAGGLILVPLCVILAMLIKLEDGGPMLYAQMRTGKDGERFRSWKFRSMAANADEMYGAIQSVRAMGYDIALDFQGAVKSAFLASISGAAAKCGFVTPREPVARRARGDTEERRRAAQLRPQRSVERRASGARETLRAGPADADLSRAVSFFAQ